MQVFDVAKMFRPFFGGRHLRTVQPFPKLALIVRARYVDWHVSFAIDDVDT